MFEIPLFVLFLQIGFNAALNNRAYSKNPNKHSFNIHSDKSDLGYRWGVNDENSDSEYYNSQSDEEYGFRSFQPQQNSYQRRNDLRYNTRPNLETASVGRINANNYTDVFQSFSSSSRRSHPNYRRPYSGLRQAQARKYYRKANGDSHLQISSLEGSNPKHASRLGEQASSLDPLLPFIEQSSNRRGQNGKRNSKGNSLSDDASLIDKFNAAFSSNSQNKRRNYRKEFSNNNLNTRRSNEGLNLDDEDSNNLSPFRKLKPGLKSHKLTNKSHDQNGSDKNIRDVLPLEYPWIDTLSSKKQQNKTKLKSRDQNEGDKNNRDMLPLKYPWIDTLSSKRKKNKSKLRSHDKTVKDSTDVLPLHYPWYDALKHNGPIRQTDSRRDKKPKRKSRPDKLSSKKTTVRTPEPIFVHPYLRNRKNKHSDYYRRSYDRFNDGLRLQHILDTPRSNRRFKNNQNLGVLPVARGSGDHKPNPKNFDPDEGSSAVITFPSDRSTKRSRLRGARRVKDSPPLLTTTERPNLN